MQRRTSSWEWHNTQYFSPEVLIIIDYEYLQAVGYARLLHRESGWEVGSVWFKVACEAHCPVFSVGARYHA